MPGKSRGLTQESDNREEKKQEKRRCWQFTACERRAQRSSQE